MFSYGEVLFIGSKNDMVFASCIYRVVFKKKNLLRRAFLHQTPIRLHWNYIFSFGDLILLRHTIHMSTIIRL